MENIIMDSDSSDDISSKQRTSKKRVKMGRERDVLKKLRATTHELEPDCKCKRYCCFENISDENKKRIIRVQQTRELQLSE